jgi:uncharacterized protein (TIGR02271 family)
MSYESSSSTQTSSAESGETKAVIPLYKENLTVGTRQVDGGTVTVKKIVKTEMVNQPVELRHEEIVIERAPASSDTASDSSGSAFTGQETVIHLMKEEPLIQKQTVSSGQVVLKARSESMQTNVQAEVRSEDVAVTKPGEGGQSMGAAESPSGQASSSGSAHPSVYSSSDAAALQGTAAEFSNRKVLSVTGDQLTCIDAGEGHPLYVYSKYGASRLKPGDYVTVTGVIKTGAADVKGATAQFLGSQHSYLYAKTIDRMN